MPPGRLRPERALAALLQVAVASSVLAHPSCASAQIFTRRAPLSLDLNNADRSMSDILKPYMINMRRRIEAVWFPKPLSPAMKVRIHFEVDSAGTLQSLQVTRSSGNPLFDARASRAIQESSPFQPVRVRLLDVDATFDSQYVDLTRLNYNLQLYRQRQQLEQQPQTAPQQLNITPSDSQTGSGANDQTAWNAQPQSSYGTGSPEVGPQADAPPSSPTNSANWSEPLTALAVKGLSEEERQDYKDWLKQWLQQPFEDRFAFLTGVAPPHSPAPPKSISKAKQSKGKRK